MGHTPSSGQERARKHHLIRKGLPLVAVLVTTGMIVLGPSYYGALAYGLVGVSLMLVGVICGGRALVVTVVLSAVAVFAVGRYGTARPIDWAADPNPAPPMVMHHPTEPGPTLMRTEFDLDRVVAERQGTDRVLALVGWTREQWSHSDTAASSSDPVSILREARAGARFRCVEYSIVLTGAAQSLGLPARRVGLKTRWAATSRSGAGHVVVEVWLVENRKWVMLDPQYGYMIEADGIPLNAVEVQDALARRRPVRVMSADGEVPWLRATYYLVWLTPYLHYFDFALDQRVFMDPSSRSGGALMLVPPSSEELRVFQRRYPLQGYMYTGDPLVFYPEM